MITLIYDFLIVITSRVEFGKMYQGSSFLFEELKLFTGIMIHFFFGSTPFQDGMWSPMDP